MKRLGAAAIVGLLLATGAPLATADEPFDSGLGAGADLEWMETLEAKVDDHLLWGQLAEISYGDASRTPGDVVQAGSWGDSGLWTGTYLAAESFRYATAEAKIGTGRGSSYWAAQRNEARARITEMVDKYHLLVNIAEGWTHTSDPYVDPTAKQPIGWGGGVITGEKGMLMRACTPASGAPGIRIEPGSNLRVFGPFQWEGEDWYCETAPSRDTYAGTTFGLLAAYDLVGEDLGPRREQIREDILSLARFLVKHGWTYPRPHGYVSINEVNDGHDFDSFISPLFVYVPLARLNMAQAARHVAQGTDEESRWEAVYAEELATQLPALAASMEIDAADPYAGYYKFNLHHLTAYSLIRLEQRPEVRAAFMQAIGVMDNTTGDDLNAHFETITYALTGEADRRDLALEHLREWQEYRRRIDANGSVDHRPRCDVDLTCVPKDQRELEGAPVAIPGFDSNERAARPLSIPERPPGDFLWQKEPVKLEASVGATHQAPGVDYLLPYWMLRYHTEVSVPGLSPFPPYPGPGHL